MSDASITFFPVGNGDTGLIRLIDKTDIVIDCNITQDSRDPSDKIRYDVHNNLLKILKKDQDKNPYVDTFILTHSDQDHCRGFIDTFYVGDPKKYGETHRKKGLIRIDELWFTPRLFSGAEKGLCEEAKAFRNEAKRRMEIYRSKSDSRSQPGNRLRVIGYSDSADLEGLESIISVPGKSVNLINGSVKNDFSFFIHAPFKEDTDSMWGEHNLTSLVLQARFDVENEVHAALAFFGGDAGCAVWEAILDRSKEDTLKWDVFMAPHHCSWSFFSKEPYKDNKVPSEKSIRLLKKKREGAIVVASCKPIKNDDDNPPHYAAQQEYIKIVGEKGKKFYATMEYPDEKQPLPLVFEISKKGPVKIDPSKSGAIASSAAIQSTIRSPQTYGR